MSTYLDDGSGGLVNQPANQATFVAQVVTTSASTSTPYGYTTAAQANNLVAAVNALLTAAIAAGIMKSS